MWFLDRDVITMKILKINTNQHILVYQATFFQMVLRTSILVMTSYLEVI